MSSSSETEEEERSEHQATNVSLYFMLFSGILAFSIVMSKMLHENRQLNLYLSEAALILLIGICAGFFVHLFLLTDYGNEHEVEHDLGTSLLTFDDNVFFLALLPPILFNSGYELRRELFFRHIKPIVLFAVVGTAVSAMSAAFFLYGMQQAGFMGGFDPSLLELLTFGSLIAATDTVTILAVFQAKRVDPHVFYLVVGESALNDAVALVLFHTFADFLNGGGEEQVSQWWHYTQIALDFLMKGIGSPALGIVFGFTVSLLFKHVDLREYHMLELSLYVLCMYIPFLFAELVNLSGIVSIFFTGLAAKRYIVPNISEKTKASAASIFKLAAYLSETCIFLDLGLSVFGMAQNFQWIFIAWAFLATLLGRALGIYPSCYIHNWSLREIPKDNPKLASRQESIDSFPESVEFAIGSVLSRRTPLRRKDKKISWSMAHMLWFAGLRGAVAYACVRKFPNTAGNRAVFVAATMLIVLFTIIVMGGGTGGMLALLGIKTGVDEEEYMREWRKDKRLKGRCYDFERKFIYKLAVREEFEETDNSEASLEFEMGYYRSPNGAGNLSFRSQGEQQPAPGYRPPSSDSGYEAEIRPPPVIT